jgi:hypothetical protein
MQECPWDELFPGLPAWTESPTIRSMPRVPRSSVEAVAHPVPVEVAVEQAASPVDDEPVAPSSIVLGPESGHPWRYRFALLGIVAWWLLLGWMCQTTANPILVSPPQWERAELAVRGRIERPDSVVVAESWLGEAPPERIRVVNLADVPGLVGDRDYVWLLVPAGTGYAVVRVPGQETPPLVYPATPEVFAQVRRLAEERAAAGPADLGAPDPRGR